MQSFWATTTRRVKYKTSPITLATVLALAQLGCQNGSGHYCDVRRSLYGETAKVLCPDKKVLVPDMEAGCSLADSCPADQFAQFVKEHPGYTVISYVNTTAAVKGGNGCGGDFHQCPADRGKFSQR